MAAPVSSTQPAYSMVAVTKSDSNVLSPTRGLYIGGAGNLSLVTSNNETVAVVGVLAGVVYPFSVKQVLDATTATNIVALY
jgi:hypothetical protein